MRLRKPSGLSDGATTVVVNDGDPADQCPGPGCVTFSGPVGDFTVNITTGLSRPVTPGAQLQLSSVDVFSALGGPTQLEIDLTDIGFSLPGPAAKTLISNISGSLSAPAGSTLDASQCVGFDNLAFGCVPGVTLTHPTFGPGGISDTQTGPFTTVAPFAITETVTLAFSGAGLAQFTLTSTAVTAAIAAVPQPRALLLLGLGLAGLWALPMLRASRRGRDD